MTDSRELDRLALFVREDVRDSVRERQAHVLAALFVLVGGGLAYAAGRSAARAPSAIETELAPTLLGPLTFLLPLVALGLVASALVEKRSTGALTVVLGLPFSRRTVVLGTLLGRSLVIVAGTLAAMGVALPVAVAMDVAVDPLQYAVVAFGLSVLAVAFTAIAVAISTVARTSTRASFAAFGAYVLFVFGLWGRLPTLVLYVVSGLEYPDAIPGWVEFVAALNPLTAFTNLVVGVVPDLEGSAFGSVPAEPALYERPAFALAILFAWIVVPIGIGYRRFRTTDL